MESRKRSTMTQMFSTSLSTSIRMESSTLLAPMETKPTVAKVLALGSKSLAKGASLPDTGLTSTTGTLIFHGLIREWAMVTMCMLSRRL